MTSDPSEHELKCWPDPFNAIWSQHKTFEVRRNDRDFKVGDILVLREWDPRTETYTGKGCRALVRYLLKGEFGLPKDICVMSIVVVRYE